MRRLLARAADTLTTLLEQGAPEAVVAEERVLADPPPREEVAAMLRMVGVALLEAGEATNDVRETLYRLATAHGIDDPRVVVFPTVVFVQLPEKTQNRTEMESVAADDLRLDQAGALERLVRTAETGALAPAEVRERLLAIYRTPAPYGWPLVVLGHTVLTLGFGLSVNPDVAALPAYVLLGAVVGLMVVLGRRAHVLATVLPVAAAFTVTILVALVLEDAVGYDPFLLLAPPLVSFLPGLTMTVAAVELTSAEVVAGASRILYGIAQLALLGFGVYAAFTVVGEIQPAADVGRLGAWAPWLGVLLTAVGYVFFSSVPRSAFLWLLACLYLTVAAQRLGNVVLSPELSGFVGALAVVPFAAAVTRWRSAPPAIVLMIPSFWLLVPGALGFIGISQAATETYDGAEALFDTALALLSIALGILVGTGISRNVAAVRRTWRDVGT